MQGAAGTIKRVTLELGGKSANVIFEDADLEKAAAAAPYSVFDNAGQDCCARSRILVQRSVYDRFLDLLVDATRGVKVGDPCRRVDGDGAARLGRASRDRRVVRRRRADLQRRDARRAGLLVPVHARRGVERRPRRAGGGVRPGCGGHPVRGRGGRDPHLERHAVRASRDRSGRATAPGRYASPGRRTPASSR